MPLITLQNVDYSVGGPLLLEHADLSIEPGERIALIGRNGAGKSTLLKLLAGELQPDDGQVRVQAGVRVARLEQEVPGGTEGSIFDVVAGGLGDLGAWLAQAFALPLVTSVGYETPGSFGSWCADLSLPCITAEFPAISSDEASEKY